MDRSHQTSQVSYSQSFEDSKPYFLLQRIAYAPHAESILGHHRELGVTVSIQYLIGH